MSTEFRILKEETFSYKNKKRLFLMLIREGGKYATEIVTSEESYGRKFFADRDEAEKVFEYFVEKLSERTNFVEITDILKAATNLSMKETSFLFIVYGKNMSQSDIGELIENFHLEIKGGRPSKDDKVIIKIYFKLKGKCIGEFKGNHLKPDFIFFLKAG